MIDHFRDPNLYEWVQLESEDASFQALDDVVALRKDASIEFVQVKFTVNLGAYFLDWDWLLEGKGSSCANRHRQFSVASGARLRATDGYILRQGAVASPVRGGRTRGVLPTV